MPTNVPSDLHVTTHDSTLPPGSPARYKVLLADDDVGIRQLLEDLLHDEGYVVVSTTNGHELVRMAQQIIPDLILVDLLMPLMDGYEAVRQLRHDTRTAHIPLLILTAQVQTHNVVVGFASGADDYIIKPFVPDALLARVQSHLRRATQRPVHSPLTGLPGNALLLEELRHRLERGVPMALLYADLDNFKAFNDTYGFARGDEAILLVAHLVHHALTLHGGLDSFVGHIGGDDFAILAAPEQVAPLCHALLTSFDHAIAQFYHPTDFQRGYLSGVDRYGMLRRFALLSLSIGVATTQQRTFASVVELTQVATEMKQYTKTQPGSSYAVDRRTAQQPMPMEPTENRRRTVQVLSDDVSLRTVLRAALYEGGYGVREIASITALNSTHAIDAPIAVIAEARMGPTLWACCRVHAGDPQLPLMVILVNDDDEEVQARSAGAAAILRHPLPIDDVVACIKQLAAPGWKRGGQLERP
ncbi:MAG: response regulator [Chloroflexales bacterium]|nr:response regulator [Chloroflexales bacterium]